MNKFRQQQDPRKNVRHEEMQLIGVLDKCTQILREDRIHIRNRIKEGDAEVLSFFKPLKQINMQQLQINLRKYLNQAKANIKMQQLIKFKENHLEVQCSCETKHTLGSTGFCKDRTRQFSKEAFKDVIHNDNRIGNCPQQWKPTLLKHERCSSMSQLPQPSSAILQHDRKKSFGSRDANQPQRGTSSTKQLPKYNKVQEFQQRASANHQQQRKRSGNSISTRHARTNSTNIARGTYHYEEAEPAAKHHNSSTGSGYKSDAKITRGMKQPSNKQPSDQPPSYEWDAKHTTSCYQPSNNNPTSQYDSVAEHSYYRPTPTLLDQDILPSQTESGFNKYRGATYDNLFTSPELLFECRKYIEKSKGPIPLPRISAEDLPSNNVFKQQQQTAPLDWRYTQHKSYQELSTVIPTTQLEIVPKTHIKLEEPTPTVIIDVAKHDRVELAGDYRPCRTTSLESKTPQGTPSYSELASPLRLESPSEPIQINLDSRTDTQRNLKPSELVPDFSDHYAEDIIDVLFEGKDSKYILAADYGYTVYSNFADTYPFERLFELADSDCDGKVSVQDLGNVLDKTAKRKDNPARQLFSLLDMEKAGRVTLEEYTRFLNQISESEQSDFAEARLAAEKVFRLADSESTGEIDYWSLYLTYIIDQRRKDNWEFQGFSGYLEQFEFSIEP